MEPKYWVKRRHLHDTHVPQTEHIMKAVMECLKVANRSAIRLVTHLAKWLVSRQKLVEHVTKVGLLFPNSHIDFIVTASSVGGVGVKRIAKGPVPVFELKLALWKC